VSVLLLYRDGSRAFEGRGEVERCRAVPSGAFEIDVQCRWSPSSTPLISQLFDDRLPTQPGIPDPTADLLQRTALPPVGAPIPVPVESTQDVLHVPSEFLPPTERIQMRPPEQPFRSPGAEWEMSPPPGQPDMLPEPSDIPAEALESGEVTPLARIELVRSQAGGTDMMAEPIPLRPIGSVPGQLDAPELEPRSKLVVGVDAGTASTRAAAVVEGAVQTVPTRRGLPSLPSVVHIDPSGKTIVGDPAARRAERTPEYGLRDVRRLLGHPHDSSTVRSLAGRYWYQLVPGDTYEAAVRIGDYRIPLEEVGALLLKEVREGCVLVLPDRANRVVLTVPGWAGPRVRDSAARAGRLAGLHVEHLVGEAAACAVAYAELHASPQETVLVVSFGAGHLDVGVARIQKGRVRMLEVGGTPRLGGADFDRALVPFLSEAVEDATGERPAETPDFWARMQTCAQGIKESLSVRAHGWGEVLQPLPRGDAFRLQVEVQREDAIRLWAPLFDGVQEVVQSVLARADVDTVDRLVLGGCAHQLPGLQRRLRELMPQRPVVELEPDAAATGAALVGDRIRQGRPTGLEEVLPRPVRVASPEHGSWWVFDARHKGTHRQGLTVPPGGEVVLIEGATKDEQEPIGRIRVPEDSGSGDVELELTADLRLVVHRGGETLSVDPAVEPSQVAAWPLPPADSGAPSEGWLGWFRRRLR
jgi:actin-like ATPase involved in cell morphogenesis